MPTRARADPYAYGPPYPRALSLTALVFLSTATTTHGFANIQAQRFTLSIDWFWNSQGSTVGGAVRRGFDTPWVPRADMRLDFQILGEPVPEPTSMLLLGGGIVGLWLSRRRARR